MFKVLDEVCQPTRATKYSAMVDLYAREDVVIGILETKIVPLGIKIHIDGTDAYNIKLDGGLNPRTTCVTDKEAINIFKSTHFLELYPQDILISKGLIIGVRGINLDYPDEIGLIVHSPAKQVGLGNGYGNPYIIGVGGTNSFIIKKGDKVAQCTLKEHKGYLLGIESDVERTGGFRSTDK